MRGEWGASEDAFGVGKPHGFRYGWFWGARRSGVSDDAFGVGKSYDFRYGWIWLAGSGGAVLVRCGFGATLIGREGL